MQQRKIYLAGPMTGIPEFNYPAFNAAAARLRAAGYNVENPAENHIDEGANWVTYMKMAIAKLVKCDCVALLPGWETSKGATLEHWLAHQLGLSVAQVECL